MKESVDIDLEWLGNMRSRARIRGFVILIDIPKENGGEVTGPKPTELLLASLGSCFMSGVAYFAKKMRINIKDLRLNISGVRESGDSPRLTQINISVQNQFEGIDPQRLQRLRALAEKYCTVGNTLKNETNVSIRIR